MKDKLLQFFQSAHLRPDVAAIAGPFATLADWIDGHLPQNPERTIALRKLMESRDAAIRCCTFTEPD